MEKNNQDASWNRGEWSTKQHKHVFVYLNLKTTTLIYPDGFLASVRLA